MADRDFVDAPINDVGLTQSTKAQEIVNAMHFSVVYVSPMYRTLMTAMNVFKAHPNRQNISFVVLPVAKEALNTCNDCVGPLSHTFDEFKDPEK